MAPAAGLALAIAAPNPTVLDRALAGAAAAQLDPCDEGRRLRIEAADMASVRQWVAWGFFVPVAAPVYAGATSPEPRGIQLDRVVTAGIPCYEDAYRARVRTRRTRAAWTGSGIALALGAGYLVASGTADDWRMRSGRRWVPAAGCCVDARRSERRRRPRMRARATPGRFGRAAPDVAGGLSMNRFPSLSGSGAGPLQGDRNGC